MIAVTADEMKLIDEIAMVKYRIKLDQMMELAGYNLAVLTRKISSGSVENMRIAVLAGKGSNGGGGLVAARHLSNWGGNVTTIVSQRQGLKKTICERLETLELMGQKTYFGSHNLEEVISDSEILIDALIGYGLIGNPRSPVSEMIERRNDSGLPVISLDLPSGLNATTGEAYNPCILATNTMTLALPKKGLLAESARRYVGGLWLADIGIPNSVYAEMGLKAGNEFKERNLIRLF